MKRGVEIGDDAGNTE